MKKFFMTIAAVLCFAMTTTVLTSCGDDDKDDIQPVVDDNTPKTVAVDLGFYFTEDMVNYCNLEIAYGDGTSFGTPIKLTKDNMEYNKNLNIYSASKVVTNGLPCTFTVKSTVTLAQNIDDLPRFTYSKGFFYYPSLYNAAGKKLTDLHSYDNPKTTTGVASKVAILINEGKLNQIVTLTFDKDGNPTAKVQGSEEEL